MPALEQLLFLNAELFSMIENSVSMELLARLLSTQLVTSGEKHLLDHKRTYYRLLRRIIADGQARGELSTRRSVNEMVKLYALCERALMYDWCLWRRGILPAGLCRLRTSEFFERLFARSLVSFSSVCFSLIFQ